MHPHSLVDSFSQSQHLASTILSSSTPALISSTCASLDSFLRSLPPDQSRHFFSITFPALICKLYGFEDSAPPTGPPPPNSGGWIDIVNQSNDPNLASSIFSLLSPTGNLFQSISGVDRHSLVKYIFPTERLPEWARFMLSNENACQVLANICPLFRNRVKENSVKGSPYCQVQLNVFEYFVFWFAYYPICKGNNDNSVIVSAKRSKMFKLENWMIPVLSNPKRGDESKLGLNLYVRLLYAYLREFVPVRDLNAHHQPYRSSLLHYEHGESDRTVSVQAEFFVDALVNYWLVDNDFSPLAVNFTKSYGLVSSLQLRSVLGEIPPTPNLGEVVKLLVEYLNLSAAVSEEGFDYVESPRRSRVSSLRDLVANNALHFSGSWNLWIQRPVYRYILRTFLFCPVGTSLKDASQVFSVWVTYMEPWRVGLDNFAELDALVDGSGKDAKKGDLKGNYGYSSLWEDYVLSNYLYYSSLVMHFIGFAHKFLHTDPEVMLQMVLKIVDTLMSCKELTDLVKKMDSTFHSKQAGSSKSMLSSLYKYAPIIHEQLLDWEDGLSETDADGSFLHENWNKDLRLFSDGEDGGQQLLQLFILRLEAELQASSFDNLADNLHRLDALKTKVSCLFGGNAVQSPRLMLQKKQEEQFRDEIFTPRRIGKQALADAKYKGDWMKRPISDDEVEWLAKLLVQLSGWLNEVLTLNQVENTDVGPRWSYIEISSDVGNVSGPIETMKVLLFAIGAWCHTLGSTLLRWMRKHGLRVNLRMLASKKIVMVFLMFAFFSILKKAFRMSRGV